jgi:hypothetical protein
MLFKKLIRTIFHYKAQFISMILMVMLGVGVFVGFQGEWYSIEKDTYSFYIDQVPASSWDNYDYWTNLTKVKYIDESSVSGNCEFKWEEKKRKEATIFL